MNNNTRAVLAIGALVACIALYVHYHKPVTAQSKQPDPQPSYVVMAKRFIDRNGGYSIEYDLLGPEGDVIAECKDPRTDGTGCEKFEPYGTYSLSKNASGRFLTDRSGGIRLTIESEGLWPDQKTDVNDPNPPND